MTETSYAARVWSIEPRKNKQGKVTSYRVRWEVAGSPFGVIAALGLIIRLSQEE